MASKTWTNSFPLPVPPRLCTCANSCSAGNCTGGCFAVCGNACAEDCWMGCTGSCFDKCTGGCTGSCRGCTGGCGSSCTGSCSGGCDGSCSSCSGSCRGSCTGSCGDACNMSCADKCTTQCTGDEMQKVGSIIAQLSEATKENLFKADDINLIAQGIVYECKKRQYEPIITTFTAGAAVDDSQIEILIKNLKMINSNFMVDEIAEGNHPWNIKTRKVIVDELQSKWKEKVNG